MEIKDQNIETATDEQGREYISEIEATMTETSADGTVSVAEMTTTANPDDPTDVEGQMTITETAPDGTETVTEYVANEEGVFRVEEESALEEMAEAVLGVEIGDDLTKVMDADGTPIIENLEETEIETAEINSDPDDFSDVYIAESDTAPVSVEFNLGDEGFDQTSEIFDVSQTPVPIESFDPTIEIVDPILSGDYSNISSTGTTDYSNETAMTKEGNQELIEQQARAEAASEAQQAADEFVAEGDYAAAAEAREIAESESEAADDDSMLGAYDAQDLESAAEKQEDAEYYQQQQAMHAQEGDYEAAREDALNAGYATADADYLAGGEDHTGQADSEVANMDNALWHEELAEDRVEDAVYHAEMGNEDAAESALDAAQYEQTTADEYGDRGEYGNILADYDPSSEVETGGSYESTYEDNLADIDTGFDTNIVSGLNAVDTGLDAGMDMAVDTGFDSGIDPSVDTSYDSGSSDV